MKKSKVPKATLIAKGSLLDFLNQPGKGSSVSIGLTFELHPSVKDLIESRGIPHTAIFGLTVNGQEKPLDYNIQEGDKIAVYPFELTENTNWDPIYSEPGSFIVDVHLGKLLKTLRLLGFDAVSNQNWDDIDIIHKSNEQHRMILTRDVSLLKNGASRFGYWMRSQDPDQQIKELFRRFSLADHLEPFSRCMKCNGLLEEVPLSKIEDRVPPKVKKWQSQFFQCIQCSQVYWKGSHYEKLQQKVDELTKISF